jgi:eukaryotic-like serine/threonine-protein kinase
MSILIRKHGPLALAALGLLSLALILVHLANPGLLRQGYLADVTEARLLRRGNSLVRIRFSARDGMNQIYIPAGAFTMGTADASQPVMLHKHKVYLDAYWIDQAEVTNAMYLLCYTARKCRHTATYDAFLDDPAYADYPVHYIDWYEARDYCAWAGERLPTEAEWEKAARGRPGYRYPWGDQRPDDSLLNFNGRYQTVRPAYDYLAGISPYGLLNMAGNVQEWVSDWFGEDYYLHSPYKDPQGPPTGDLKILRGGGYWDNATEVQTFFRFRHEPTSAGAHRGIRCAQSAAN